MANLTFTPPNVQEQIVFHGATNSNSSLSASSTSATASMNANTSTVSSVSPPQPTNAAAVFKAKRSKPQRSHEKPHHKEKSSRHAEKNPRVEPPAVPADFVNLVNADKLKPGADTQLLFAREVPNPSPPDARSSSKHSSKRPSKSKREREDSESDSSQSESDSDADSGSESDSGASDSGSDSETDSKGGRTDEFGDPKPTAATSTQNLFDKAKLLARLARRQKLYPNSNIEFNHNMSLEELQTIDAKAGYESQADMSIQLMKRGILIIVGLSEAMAASYPNMGLNLQGWGEHVFLSMQQYEETLFDVYDQYSSAFQMNPIIRLAVALGTSAWMFSTSKKMMEEFGTVRNTTLEQLQDAIKKAAAAQSKEPTSAAAAAAQSKEPAQTTTRKPININAAAMKPPSGSGMQAQLDPARIMKIIEEKQAHTQQADARDTRRVDIPHDTSGRGRGRGRGKITESDK